MSQLSTLGFFVLWNPYMILFSVILLFLYYALISIFRAEKKEERPFPLKNQILFILGVLIFYAAKGSPINVLGHITFSMHMVQMVLLYLLSTPLLVLGIPTWVYEEIFKFNFIRKPFQFFTRPVISALLFNGLFSIYHYPDIYDYLNTTYLLHNIYLLILFITSIFMWWPILSPLPDQKQLSELRKIAYIFIDGILITPACVMIIFADTALYRTFSDPELWAVMFGFCIPANANVDMGQIMNQFFNFLPPKDDQQLGGVLMKLMQEIIYGTVLAYVFIRWVRKEKLQNNKIDPVPAFDQYSPVADGENPAPKINPVKGTQ